MKTLNKAFLFLLTLELVFVIHEYGHYTEMTNRGIAVQEFSLGIGPAIYQYQVDNLTLSLRLIPIMAYVMPTKDGYEIQKSSSFGNKFAISFAGVRNNILSGVGAVLFLNFVSWKRGLIEGTQFIKRCFFYPIKVFWMFVLFFIDTFTLSKFSFGKNCKLLTSYVHPPKAIENFIFLSLAIGFSNVMPFYPLDGSKIFIELVSRFLGEASSDVAQTISQYALYFFLFMGVPNMKFVDYDEFVK